MSILGRLGLTRSRNNQSFTEPFWRGFSPMSKSGQSVNAQTALQVNAVFDCLRVLGEGVAQVPFKSMKYREGGGSDPAIGHPTYRLAYRRPNSWQTSFEFRENMIFQAALLGDFYCFKNIVRGRLMELIPFPPGAVTVRQDQTTGKLFYNVTIHATGPKANGEPVESKEFPPEVIWHVRGPSWDTLTGMQAITLARESIGLSLATEEAHALLHGNGAQMSGLYSIEGTLTPEQNEALRKWVAKQITGANRFTPFILDRGAKFTPSTMTGVDAQHLETRRFQIEEICRRFRVMPIMVGAGEKTSTYASAEQMFLAHVVHTLNPWYERIEQSADVNLLTEREQDQGYYFKFFPNALMRGAAKDRAEFYWKRYQMRSLNPNEIRALEDENPYEGGNEFYVQQGTLANTPDQDDKAGDDDEKDHQA